MYNVPPTPIQSGPAPRGRRIWRAVNVAAILFGMSQDWVTACSGDDPLTGYELALSGTAAGMLQVSIPLLILLTYCLLNLAIVIFGRREPRRWLLGLLTVSAAWIGVLMLLIGDGLEEMLIGFWVTMAGVLSSLALEVLGWRRRVE